MLRCLTGWSRSWRRAGSRTGGWPPAPCAPMRNDLAVGVTQANSTTRGRRMDTAGLDPPAPDDGRFRLGLVGAGRMGRTHLEAISGSDVVAIAGVGEPQTALRSALRGLGI